MAAAASPTSTKASSITLAGTPTELVGKSPAVSPPSTPGAASSPRDLSPSPSASTVVPPSTPGAASSQRDLSPSPSASTVVELDDSPKVLFAEPKDAPEPHAGVTTLPSLFIDQAKAQPDHPFLTFHDGSDSSPSLTYREALDKSSRLARGLHKLAPKVVGVWFEKSIDLHLAILAVAQSGAAWLPFDPDAPADRVRTCLTDSAGTVLLCDEAHRKRAEEVGDVAKAMSLEELDQESDGDKAVGPSGDDTAYMIYTSGSTGTPKGIAIPHSAALTFALSERTVLGTSPKDVVWQGFSPAFDMFVEEVWVSIAGGAHLIVGSRGICQDVANLGAVWTQHGVTVVNAVPTMINIMTSLSDGGLPPSVRLINLGGEACPPSLVKRLHRPDLTIVNTYGPTETTVTATCDILEPEAPVTIGKPLPSYHVLVLPIPEDEPKPATELEPLDIEPGVEGQLCIGGGCLGEGYVNRPELTAEKFMEHPLDPEQRLYQTGDRVRIGDDSKIHFVGRIDTQVKHRGFRIELGEIDSALSTHDDVQVAAVICARAGEENAQLEAYIVTKSGNTIEISVLKDNLSALPAYMHPEAYFFLEAEEMPRLPSGKINLKGLAEISEKREESKAAQIEATAAKFDNNFVGSLHTLMDVMKSVFPQAAASGVLTPTADFFDDLGGHSLTAAVLVSRLRKDHPDSILATLGLADIYTLRTPQAISDKYVDEDEETLSGEPDPATIYHPVKQWRWVLCGLAQIPPLIFFAFVHSVIFLAPYFLFAEMFEITTLYFAFLSAFACFVVFPPILLILGIVGKWVVIGRAKAGEYPLYGVYYYRWWLAGRFTDLVDHRTWAELGFYPVILRMLGAKVGKYCNLASMAVGPCMDLVEIGDDVVVGHDVALVVSVIERGLLVVKPVYIGTEASIGSRCAIEGGGRVEAGASLSAMTMVADGVSIPTAEHWHGSPAQYLGPAVDAFAGKPSRPSLIRFFIFNTAAYFIGSIIMPLLWVIPQIPGLWLFVVVDLPGFTAWTRTAVLALPSSLAFLLAVFFEIVILRRLLLGRITPGKAHKTTSWFFLRKWLVDRSMDMSLTVLHPVYATLYVIPYLRALGVKIGRGAEFSNAKGFTYDLTDVGEEAFIADNVRLGDSHVHANTITFEKTTVSPRAFSGNSSLLSQGTHLPSNTLVGVLSIGPLQAKPLKEGESCFGSPPVLMPQRQAAKVQHDDAVLYRPTARMIATRLFIEGCRIWLPRGLIAFAIGFSVQIYLLARSNIGVVYTLLMLPFYEIIMFCIPALIITVALKWILIGRYKHDEWPLWSRNVWFSEAVTSTAESLIGPLFLVRLVGTPFLPPILRLFGTKIGKRCTFMSYDITEWDLVKIGDEVVMNAFSGPQTHLFEDRVMKLGTIKLEDRAVLKPYTICLPNSTIGESSELGPLSLLMKGEGVQPFQKWQGCPVARRATRYGMLKSDEEGQIGEKGQ